MCCSSGLSFSPKAEPRFLFIFAISHTAKRGSFHFGNESIRLHRGALSVRAEIEQRGSSRRGHLGVLKLCEVIFYGFNRTWGEGARGEEKLGAALAELETRGWTVLHDVVLDSWNIDHVAIGPTGVFTIETKSHRGRIQHDGQQLLRGGRPLEKDFLRQAKSQGLWLGKQLEQRGHSVFVTPIVCFTRAYVRIPKSATRPVVVVPLKWLLETLERGKVRLNEAALRDVTAAVRDCCAHVATRADDT